MAPVEPVGMPPGPRWPRPLATLAWITRPNAVLERCRARYGDIFSLRIAYAGDWVFLGDPDAVRELFTCDSADANAGEGNDVLRPVLGRHSVLLLDGDAHLAHRRVLLPPFHGAQLRRCETLMAELAREQIARWPRDQPLKLWPRMQAITLEIILHAVLGISDEPARTTWRRAIVDMLDFLMRRGPMLGSRPWDPSASRRCASSGRRWLRSIVSCGRRSGAGGASRTPATTSSPS